MAEINRRRELKVDTSQEPPGGLDMSSVLVRNENIVFTPLDDDIVMMDVDEGQYFELDPVAARIWTLIDEGRTMRSIRDALMEEYDVSAETCSRDMLEFVQTALKMGIVRVETDV